MKVMLVDDERLILEGLQAIIDWDDLGLEIACTASNGQEAVEKFKENPVDIVVTDINMPKVTGLELLKALKSINDDVKFVVLSGYDEFAYAKSAMELGVKSYLLKPVDEEELERVLKSIIDDVDSKNKKENNLTIKNSKLIDFLNSKINIDEIKEFSDVMKIGFDGDSYMVANIISSCGRADEIMSCIRNNIFSSFEIMPNYDGSIIIVNCLENSISDDGIREFYEIINNVIKDELGIDTFISVGNKVSRIEDVSESYKNSIIAKKNVLVKGYGHVIFSDEIVENTNDSKSFKKEIETLNKLIIEKNRKAATDYLLSVFEDENLSPKNIYDISIKVVILVDEVLKDFNLDNKYGSSSLSSVIVDLCNEATRENIERFLLSEVEDAIKVISDNTQVYSPVVQQVVKTINTEYKEELSLKTLATKYRINSSYLGQIFSKEVGVSFSDYLNKVKNTKAKELILNTNMKINNIAKEVGYTDTSYFYRKFKKYYGVCPSTLRDMKNY